MSDPHALYKALNGFRMGNVRERQKYLHEENRKFPNHLVEIPKSDWPQASLVPNERKPVRVLRSKEFIVQVYNDVQGDSHYTRISVNRSMLNSVGHWVEGISWDELMQLKREAGYGDMLAIEFYPPDKDIVNVANIRHLWIINAGTLPHHWQNNREPH